MSERTNCADAGLGQLMRLGLVSCSSNLSYVTAHSQFTSVLFLCKSFRWTVPNFVRRLVIGQVTELLAFVHGDALFIHD
jgi:hypothetical protein